MCLEDGWASRVSLLGSPPPSVVHSHFHHTPDSSQLGAFKNVSVWSLIQFCYWALALAVL